MAKLNLKNTVHNSSYNCFNAVATLGLQCTNGHTRGASEGTGYRVYKATRCVRVFAPAPVISSCSDISDVSLGDRGVQT